MRSRLQCNVCRFPTKQLFASGRMSAYVVCSCDRLTRPCGLRALVTHLCLVLCRCMLFKGLCFSLQHSSTPGHWPCTDAAAHASGRSSTRVVSQSASCAPQASDHLQCGLMCVQLSRSSLQVKVMSAEGQSSACATPNCARRLLPLRFPVPRAWSACLWHCNLLY